MGDRKRGELDLVFHSCRVKRKAMKTILFFIPLFFIFTTTSQSRVDTIAVGNISDQDISAALGLERNIDSLLTLKDVLEEKDDIIVEQEKKLMDSLVPELKQDDLFEEALLIHNDTALESFKHVFLQSIIKSQSNQLKLLYEKHQTLTQIIEQEKYLIAWNYDELWKKVTGYSYPPRYGQVVEALYAGEKIHFTFW